MNYKKKLILKSTYEELDKLEGFLNDLQTDLKFDDEFYARLMLTVKLLPMGWFMEMSWILQKKLHLMPYITVKPS